MRQHVDDFTLGILDTPEGIQHQLLYAGICGGAGRPGIEPPGVGRPAGEDIHNEGLLPGNIRADLSSSHGGCRNQET
ncbi:MAG: hypothetical protein ACOX3I_08690 [Limnochordia bacterium]